MATLPIETAPRDGSTVTLVLPDDARLPAYFDQGWIAVTEMGDWRLVEPDPVGWED